MSVDLNNLKEQIQTILLAANTTTASRDLSSGLVTRVNRVLKLNPGRIPVQASWYPFVTTFIESKSVLLQDMAATKATAKRRSEVEVKIVGAVWNSTFSDNEVDPSDDECEDLMENVEEILRGNDTLNGAVTWHATTDVSYYNTNLDEETHIRVGILSLRASVFY